MSSGPNPAVAAWAMVRARRVTAPAPDAGSTRVIDHGGLTPILDQLRQEGVRTLSGNSAALHRYRGQMEGVSPDSLTPQEALAFWMNLYNAGALRAAGDAYNSNAESVLRVPGAFSGRWAVVDREELSLDDIEHGKIRRFGDPRIHGALICGSASCPTLRAEAYTGDTLDFQLDDQLRHFIAQGGGSVSKGDNTVWLSSVFKWYGRDFTQPQAMPHLTPPAPGRLRDTIAHWFPPNDAAYVWETQPAVKFMPYDWGLGCSVS
ncbi:MAG: DUF547 domain-containing protein [Acidimicrobiia bacterium]